MKLSIIIIIIMIIIMIMINIIIILTIIIVIKAGAGRRAGRGARAARPGGRRPARLEMMYMRFNERHVLTLMYMRLATYSGFRANGRRS